tara:strand:+ start:263 stop:430 length:168 start_codon:yes stop_codon:yes gene_type:complete
MNEIKLNADEMKQCESQARFLVGMSYDGIIPDGAYERTLESEIESALKTKRESNG